MSSVRKYPFLSSKEQTSYISNCLRLSVESCKQSIQDGKCYIEIDFPPNRKSDLSVTETLDTNRAFIREFSRAWLDYGKDLWIVFPDADESRLAKQSREWGDSIPFTVTSIKAAIGSVKEYCPKLLIVVNPGFNVDEWIELPKLDIGCPIIIVNGNLERVSLKIIVIPSYPHHLCSS